MRYRVALFLYRYLHTNFDSKDFKNSIVESKTFESVTVANESW